MRLAALLADEVPAGAAHAAVAAVARPAAAVVAAAVVPAAPGRSPAARVRDPHVVRDRMLEIVQNGLKWGVITSL